VTSALLIALDGSLGTLVGILLLALGAGYTHGVLRPGCCSPAPRAV
jgi:hypothetical protein